MFCLNEIFVNKLDFVILTHGGECLSAKNFQVMWLHCLENSVTMLFPSFLHELKSNMKYTYEY